MFGVMLVCGREIRSVFQKEYCELKAVVPGTYGLFTTTAFIMLFIGAAAKLGAMPFHSWIPEASTKAPVAFMVFMVTAVEKILGVYLLIRITNDFFYYRTIVVYKRFGDDLGIYYGACRKRACNGSDGF
jgi:formate hydrogenlyase subunit 3/multisubunit Na+/H+ antiporter MnhD subunit